MVRKFPGKSACVCLTCMGALLLCTARPLFAQQDQPRKPLQAKLEDGAEYRWLNKKVLDSRLLDGMEDLAHWSFKGDGDMALSDAFKKDGQHSLRIRSTSNIARVAGEGEWEDLVATRKFPGEDWRKYNRISLWVYADVAGAPAIAASLMLHNEGAHLLPDQYNEGRDESLLLKNHAWNHLVWEIAPLDRDKITAIDFAYSLPKMFPDPGDHTTLYIDQLELQTVVPDHVEGWDVAAGKIAFSHSGYTVGSSKSAIASDLAARSFSVIDHESGKVVLTKAVEEKKSSLGAYQVMDFSELQKPGTYQIRAGNELTRPFTISNNTWVSSVWKVINFMYSERCGTVIPGIHGICHQDDYTLHGDKRIVINGGYHDAGDLTATGNVTGMTYALLSYAERLDQQQESPELRDRLIEEGKWGLAWMLKTRFGDGYRSKGQLISYWTNGIMGDADDRFGQAVNNPEWNFRVAASEALAARVLKSSDPELANRSILLSETKALSVAARERGDLEADDLAQKQAQWFIGRNPFSASIMYGEGYDWMPLYSVRSGQMVGALPVGIETKGNTDAPYWPTQNCWTYKEVWSQPAGEWIGLMSDLNGPAVVRGFADRDKQQPIEFRDTRTGLLKTVSADAHDGAFRVLLPQGNYALRQGATHAALTAISGGTYDLDLRPEKAVDYSVKAETEASGDIVLRVAASGIGPHSFSIRADNLKLDGAAEQTINLASGKTTDAVWHARILSTDTPWVAVVIADRTLANRRELTGTAHMNSPPAN